jgi:nucleoside-diphosphate-sugar epimerase
MFTIVAGTGYTGHRVLEMLPADSVAGLSRSDIETNRPFNVVDFDNIDSLRLNLPDRYAVLYTCPPDDNKDTRLSRFLTLLHPAPTRFVYISTTGVYGDCGGAAVTEEAPINAQSRLSRPRVVAERLLTTWAAKSGVDVIILRAPAIYGPGRLGEDNIRRGIAYLCEEDANPGNRIHVDDLAKCCLAALSEVAPAGIYNVGDGDHRSGTAFIDEVARQAGLPEPNKISRAQAATEFSKARLAFISSSRIIDTTKMREVLGFEPEYTDPAEGIRASLGL